MSRLLLSGNTSVKTARHLHSLPFQKLHELIKPDLVHLLRHLDDGGLLGEAAEGPHGSPQLLGGNPPVPVLRGDKRKSSSSDCTLSNRSNICLDCSMSTRLSSLISWLRPWRVLGERSRTCLRSIMRRQWKSCLTDNYRNCSTGSTDCDKLYTDWRVRPVE